MISARRRRSSSARTVFVARCGYRSGPAMVWFRDLAEKPTEGELPKRILIVEDEYLIAQDMADDVRQLGFDVVGPVGRLGEAIDLVDTNSEIDAAFLDVNLNGEHVYP